MTVYDPPAAPRQRESGYKGDGWTVTLPPPGGADSVLGLDTGLDSVAILRVPDAKWDRGDRPLAVHAHADHDETVVIPTGSGTLYHGADPAAHHGDARSWRRSSSCSAAGVFHHVVMDLDCVSDRDVLLHGPGNARWSGSRSVSRSTDTAR